MTTEWLIGQRVTVENPDGYPPTEYEIEQVYEQDGEVWLIVKNDGGFHTRVRSDWVISI